MLHLRSCSNKRRIQPINRNKDRDLYPYWPLRDSKVTRNDLCVNENTYNKNNSHHYYNHQHHCHNNHNNPGNNNIENNKNNREDNYTKPNDNNGAVNFSTYNRQSQESYICVLWHKIFWLQFCLPKNTIKSVPCVLSCYKLEGKSITAFIQMFLNHRDTRIQWNLRDLKSPIKQFSHPDLYLLSCNVWMYLVWHEISLF